MTFLLFVTAALVAVSAGLKLRSTARVGLGLAPLALLEMAMAVALGVLVLPSPLSGTAVERWSVPVAIVVLVVSSVDHAFRLRRYRRARAESEGGRLATYVRYLSETDRGGGGGGTGKRPGDHLDTIDDADDGGVE